MKWLPKLVIECGIIFLITAIGTMGECCESTVGWEQPNPNASMQSIHHVISHRQNSEKNLQIKYNDVTGTCGLEVYYDLIELQKNQLLLTLPLPRRALTNDDGRILDSRIQQVLKTTRKELFQLQKASKDFAQDNESMRKTFGIFAQLSDANSNQNNQSPAPTQIFINYWITEYCTPELIQGNLILTKSTTMINPFQYIPGRTEYPTTYQSGELLQGFVKSLEHRNELRTRALSNMQSCVAKKRLGDTQEFWAQVVQNLNILEQR